MRRPESVADYDAPFTSSIVRYPQRGPDGDNRYRGNTSGYIVRQFLATYHRERTALFVDPMEGGRTSRDAAAALGIRYAGLDLRDGFDAQRDDLLARIRESAGSIWLHPPYAGMIAYSGNMWGESHASDLSRMSVDDFHEALHAVLINAHRALQPGGVYGVLLGSWRTKGDYHHLPAVMTRYAPGTLVSEVIKEQSNVTSAAKTYGGSFTPIAHETLLVYRRAADASIFAVTIDALDQLQRAHTSTWRNLVMGYARECGEFTLDSLYAAFDGHPKAESNPHFREKLRQVAASAEDLQRLSRGRYAFVTAPS